MRRLTILAAVVMLAASSVNYAQGQGKGKGPHGGAATSTLSLVNVTDPSRNVSPNYGDQVTFDVSTDQNWNQVSVICTQNSEVVFGAVWPNTSIVTLSSTKWVGGAAECSAVLIAFNGSRDNVLASLSFTTGQ
jgi:hypothetical protein